METPRTRYVERDGVNIAWQVFGDGPAEILFVPGWVSNVDLFWQYPQPQEFFTELAASREWRSTTSRARVLGSRR